MCGLSEHTQPPYFYLQLPCVSVCVNGSNEGDCTKRICVLLKACNLYAPQGVDLGEDGSLSYWHDTVKSDWPWLQNVKQSQKLIAKLTGHYIKILQLQLLGCPGTKNGIALPCLSVTRRPLEV